MPSQNGRRRGNSVQPVSKRPAPADSGPLTRRETEVAEWIAEGKRNREIGEILGCSARTVQKHVEHILEKLQLETRTSVCVWCLERRLSAAGRARARRKSSQG
jgi:DNA-binding NarL/FixJ family response regulator